MKDCITAQGGKMLNFLKETFREGFRRALIDDDPLWLDTIRLRNLTCHTYKEEVAEEIFQALPRVIEI